HEVCVLQLGHGTHAAQGHADGHTYDQVFTDGRVEDAITELLRHSARDTPHAAELSDVLAEDHHGVVAPQLDAQSLADRVCVFERARHHVAAGSSTAGRGASDREWESE